jgi:hypothetical protein
MEWVPVVFITFKAIILFTGMFFSIKWHYDQDKKKKQVAREQQAAAEHTPDTSDEATGIQR